MSERGSHERPTLYGSIYAEGQNGRIYGDRKWLPRSGGVGEKEGVTASRYRISLGGDKNVLKLRYCDGYKP